MFQGLESWLHGVPVGCSVLYNMHHEGSSLGPGRAWGGAFMAFTIFGSLLSSPFQGLERRLQGVPVRCSVLYNMHHEGSSSARQLPCNTWEWPGTYKSYCSRPLPALAGRGLMRTLCCAVCAMKGSGLGRCSMQLAGGCLIHKLYPLTFSFATRPLSALLGGASW